MAKQQPQRNYGTASCCDCGIDFIRNASNHVRCHECSLEKKRAYRRMRHHKTYDRVSEHKRKMGIKFGDREIYEKLFQSQKGLCAICDRPETNVKNGKIVNLSVDHDHATGTVRGLLCSNCNTAIGLLRDNPELLFRAIKFLEKSKTVKKRKLSTRLKGLF